MQHGFHSTLDTRHDGTSTATQIHAYRTTGGRVDHRDPGGDATTGPVQDPPTGQDDAVHEQPPRAGHDAQYVLGRQRRLLPAAQGRRIPARPPARAVLQGEWDAGGR